MLEPLWKIVWQFLKNLNINPPYDLAILLLGIYSREKKAYASLPGKWLRDVAQVSAIQSEVLSPVTVLSGN